MQENIEEFKAQSKFSLPVSLFSKGLSWLWTLYPLLDLLLDTQALRWVLIAKICNLIACSSVNSLSLTYPDLPFLLCEEFLPPPSPHAHTQTHTQWHSKVGETIANCLTTYQTLGLHYIGSSELFSTTCMIMYCLWKTLTGSSVTYLWW